MVKYLEAGQVSHFVAAAGVLAHYCGDASQPLHCSWLHHGVPPLMTYDGRERAAIAATVIMYRPRSALRDMAKVFGLDLETGLKLSQVMQWWDGGETLPERISEAGFDTGILDVGLYKIKRLEE